MKVLTVLHIVFIVVVAGLYANLSRLHVSLKRLQLLCSEHTDVSVNTELQGQFLFLLLHYRQHTAELPSVGVAS